MSTLFRPRPRLARRIAGRVSKKSGEEWEFVFVATCQRKEVRVTRIPDGCKQIGQQRIIRVKTPFDFIISFGGRVGFIDTKKLSAKSFPYSQIDQHQIEQMWMHECDTLRSGYVVYLSKTNQVIFIPVRLMIERKRTGSFDQETPGVVHLGDFSNFDMRKVFTLGE